MRLEYIYQYVFWSKETEISHLWIKKISTYCQINKIYSWKCGTYLKRADKGMILSEKNNSDLKVWRKWFQFKHHSNFFLPQFPQIKTHLLAFSRAFQEFAHLQWFLPFQCTWMRNLKCRMDDSYWAHMSTNHLNDSWTNSLTRWRQCDATESSRKH